MELQKNDVIELTVTDISTDGNGVGRHEGMAVFVPGTAAGDRLKVKIVKTCKNYSYGIAAQALSPSPDRVEPGCPVFRQCGGCSLRHISYGAELRIKQNWVYENLRRIGGVREAQWEPILPSPKQSGYRNKAQYPVAEGEDGELRIGFYAKRSHRIIDGGACDLQPPVFGEIVDTIRQICQYHHIPAYDEVSRRGLLRHIYLRSSAHAEEIMVCFVLQNPRLPHAQEFVAALTERFPQIKSIVINVNSQPTNVILGRQCRTLWGSDTIHDTLCGMRFSISPLSFYQVNREGAQALYETARDFASLTGEETLLDLYCGAGTIGLSMASQVKSLIGVEIVPEAIDDAKRNADLNGIKNARFLCADAAKAAKALLDEGLTPDVVVLDPPRKGCDPATIEAVASMGPDRVVMVSCNSATAARDCALFAQKGYRVTRVRPVDMFPRTTHVECVILLTKVGEEEPPSR
ncbi:23S rRNA (uracil(1939)-C(5))-methyltransferase RlmD [Zongyangia hominis]|uniref:23S rRNA (Uracil(1939)-C(5))-methyltransferase RlmD n=1 Tax=Zongyangia hominis TaxID=2763677 RepID=A0A926ICD1_9FIRM|nr:23S rRNA (uracil(1939)-C(5))-methyltransferase RlmD [Zongyangia hominis]MBC8571097.1 23S rRNA (uracil(1939)-C(5))-methyltransferase RlmD [Zongyangia hominis]